VQDYRLIAAECTGEINRIIAGDTNRFNGFFASDAQLL